MSPNKRSSSKTNKDSNAYLQKKYDRYSVVELERNLDVLNEILRFDWKELENPENPLRKEYSKINKCSKGAYEIMRTGENIKVILLSSGSETSLACEVSHKLATENIYSKVISMPCQELFDKQDEIYKKEIFSGTELLVSIEASETEFWKKYTGSNGMNFGINDFGKSAPYKDIFKDFKLTAIEISNKTKNIINKN